MHLRGGGLAERRRGSVRRFCLGRFSKSVGRVRNTLIVGPLTAFGGAPPREVSQYLLG